MTRRALESTCPQCWAEIVTGYDGDACAFMAAVDSQRLTHRGELLAVCDGRRTYALDIHGALHRRDRWQLRRQGREPVLAEHRCHQPIPATWRAAVVEPTRQEVDF